MAIAACPTYGSTVTSTVDLEPGDRCFALQAGSGGVINAPGVTITGTPPATPPFPGFFVYAHDSGQINFSDASAVDVTVGQTVSGGVTLTTNSALAAVGLGSVIDARNGTTVTVGNQGHGIYMLNGGQVLLDSSTWINVNSTGFGVIVDNTATTLKDIAISINGASATSFGNGLQVRNGGEVAIDGSLNLTGSGAIQAISVTSNGAVTIAPDASVDIQLTNARGQNVFGVNATTGGQLFGGHLNISVPNGNGYGFRSVDLGSFIDGTNSRVELGPDTSSALAAAMLNGGLVKLDGTTTIHSLGTAASPFDNVGLRIDGTVVPDGTIGPGLTLTMDGTNGIGVWASSTPTTSTASSVSMDHLTVTGTGLRIGMIADGGSTITATDSTITVNANGRENATALFVRGNLLTSGDPTLVGGTINLINSTASLLGPAGATGGGLRAFFSDPGHPSVVNLDHSSLTTDQAPGITAIGALLEVNLANGSQVAGGGGLMVQALTDSGDPSVVSLAATGGSQLTGDAVADADSTLNIALAGDSRWTGAAHNVANVTIDPSTWVMTGSSTVSQTTTNGGLIQFAPPNGDRAAGASYKTLSTGSYVGQDGTIGLNTFLGDDASPSDRLVINGGTASGHTALRVTNTGGPGAETTGDGILVVQAANGAATSTDAFTLANTELRAGAHDYRLFRGSPAELPDATVAHSWFLRSNFIPEAPGETEQPEPPGNGNGGGSGVEPEPPPIEEPIGSDPPPEPLPENAWPIIGPELATYGVVQPIARQMGLAVLGTLHERIGDTAAEACAPDRACRPAPWGRLIGQQINNRYRAFADPRAKGQLLGLQLGVDLWRGSLIPGHSDTVGVYGAYANGGMDVTGLVTNAAATAYELQHTGSVNLDAYSLGAYWTHYGPSGWYADLVLQGSAYHGSAKTPFAQLRTQGGAGFAASLEGGYPIALPALGPRFVLEPQAQIIWQRVSFGAANDGLGPVSLGATSGAAGRLGLRGRWTLDDAAGREWQPYALANVWRDWDAEATTRFGADPVPLRTQATRLEFGGGLTVKTHSRFSFYAQAGYQFAVSPDNVRRDGVKGDIGAHYHW